jgi:uncharacterized membrane protein YedE/YeeE
MLYSVFLIVVLLIVAPTCFFFGFRIGRILGRAEQEREPIIRKKVKVDEKVQAEERKKAQKIRNYMNYDGTPKGQEKI